jgi:hypothetical protein
MLELCTFAFLMLNRTLTPRALPLGPALCCEYPLFVYCSPGSPSTSILVLPNSCVRVHTPLFGPSRCLVPTYVMGLTERWPMLVLKLFIVGLRVCCLWAAGCGLHKAGSSCTHRCTLKGSTTHRPGTLKQHAPVRQTQGKRPSGAVSLASSSYSSVPLSIQALLQLGLELSRPKHG